ncbi:MAG TPA: PRC-barrel domain-containing protein [Micropepsaceae bacterium]|nr:PRC-barrel domain-containing protein [Micropepsaceae bacterium]
MKIHSHSTRNFALASLVASLAFAANGALAAGTSDPHATEAKTATHTMALGAVSNPKDTLAKAKVVDAAGNSIGSVDDVTFDKKGKPTSLKVDVGGFLGVGDKDVAMKASAFKFDPDRKVLVTTMTKDQIKKLPEIKS